MNRAVACSFPILAASIAIVASLAAMASSAQGLLLDGQTVATTHFHGTAPDKTDAIGPVNTVVGSGVELTNFGWPSPGSGFLSIDFSDTRIVITATADAPRPDFFDVLRFLDANGTIPPFVAVVVNPRTTWPGVTTSRVFFDADRIDLNLTRLPGRPGDQIILDITGGVATPPGPTDTPTPTSTPTNTLTPTNTPTLTPTATACVQRHDDVHEDDDEDDGDRRGSSCGREHDRRRH